jgi:hypothetical protein
MQGVAYRAVMADAVASAKAKLKAIDGGGAAGC